MDLYKLFDHLSQFPLRRRDLVSPLAMLVLGTEPANKNPGYSLYYLNSEIESLEINVNDGIIVSSPILDLRSRFQANFSVRTGKGDEILFSSGNSFENPDNEGKRKLRKSVLLLAKNPGEDTLTSKFEYDGLELTDSYRIVVK